MPKEKRDILVTELVEKELVNVTLGEAEMSPAQHLTDIADVTITNVQDDDVLSFDQATGHWINKNVIEVAHSQFVFNEIPTQIAGALYSVVNKYVSGSLQVFVNGLKIYATQITYDSLNAQFTLDFTPDGSDLMECNYVKQ